jgi:alkanesulfonate monooxygenase
MPSRRQLHLGAFMRPASIHTGAWRYPGAWPDMNFNFAHIKRCIQTLEQAKFDAFFMADHMAVLNMPVDALKRSHTVTSFEPFTLLSALSQATSHIGLVATGSTTFDAPYHIARRFASLDHISGGRAGWNIVTTSNPDAALNFGLDEHMEHGERYRRAREFYDVVTGLWDSFADDAFIRDVENGVYFDPDKMHVLGHKGEFLSVRGPLNIARPVQGWPVIVQAGVRARTPARSRDRGGGVHGAVEPQGRTGVLCRREGPRREGRTIARSFENSTGMLRRGRRHRRGGARKARQAR